jgi:homoserine dehydrogenase
MKLLATVRDHSGEIELHVRPTLIPADHMLASVNGALNAVLVKGDVVGDTLYYGMGAGSLPTASAVLADIVDVARRIVSGCSEVALAAARLGGTEGSFCNADKVRTRCYLRLSLLDQPGSMGRICDVLGDHGISIASVLQKEARAGEYVPVVIVTHEATEEEFQRAVDSIDSMKITDGGTVRVRIEDFD